jgi:hypothetical protein
VDCYCLLQTEVAVGECLNKLTRETKRVVFKESVSKIKFFDRTEIILCRMGTLRDQQQQQQQLQRQQQYGVTDYQQQ